MLALPLYRPWCFYVAAGLKTIETRTHAHYDFLVGRRIGIYACKTHDHYAFSQASRFVPMADLDKAEKRFLNWWGCVIATVRVKSCGFAPNSSSACQEASAKALCDVTGRHLLWLDELHVCVPIVPAKARHAGLWPIPAPSGWTADELERALNAATRFQGVTDEIPPSHGATQAHGAHSQRTEADGG